MFNINKKRLLSEFIELVKIDSETKYETMIARVLTKKLQQLGCYVKEDSTQRQTGHGAGNLICTLKGSLDDVDPIYFSAHMDTVIPGCGINPVINDGYISSDGTTILGADDKAGIAAILEAIKILKEQHMRHGDVQFIFTVGEESGFRGAKALDPINIQAQFGYALDSNGLVGDIVISAPTQARICTTITSNVSHMGTTGKSMSPMAIAAQSMSKMSLGQIDDETAATIVGFESRKQTTIDIVAEVRSLKKEKLDQQVQQIKEAFTSTTNQFGGTAHVQVDVMYPSFSQQPHDKVVEIARSAVQMIGRKSQLVKSNGGSDANIFASYGIPTVNLAVGYEHIHTTRERIAICELTKLAELVIAIIYKVAQV